MDIDPVATDPGIRQRQESAMDGDLWLLLGLGTLPAGGGALRVAVAQRGPFNR